MADKTLSTIVGGAAAPPLVMPKVSADATRTSIKTAFSSVADSDDSAFWTVITNIHTEQGWDSVQLQAVANTSEQTVIDLSGEAGVLTQVLAPGVSGPATITIRITADGVVKTFTQTFTSSNQRFGLGHFMSGNPTTVATTAYGPGTAADSGYATTSERMLMTTPQQAINSGVGIPFSDSLKVTVQSTVAFTTDFIGRAAVVLAKGKLGGE